MAAAGLYTRGTYLTSFRDTTFILVQHHCPMLAASTAYSEQRTAAWAWAFCICGALSLAPRLANVGLHGYGRVQGEATMHLANPSVVGLLSQNGQSSRPPQQWRPERSSTIARHLFRSETGGLSP